MYKYETISSDTESQFDEMLNRFCARVKNPKVTFHSSPVPYNDHVITMFIAHVKYEEETQ